MLQIIEQALFRKGRNTNKIENNEEARPMNMGTGFFSRAFGSLIWYPTKLLM